MPILDFITNPDTLNLLVVTALEPNKSELEDTSKVTKLEVLKHFFNFRTNEFLFWKIYQNMDRTTCLIHCLF